MHEEEWRRRESARLTDRPCTTHEDRLVCPASWTRRLGSMMPSVTNSADLHPARIPGYGGGPLTYQAGLLDEPLFWLGHLSSCIQSEEAEELLFGAEYDAAGAFQRRLWERAEWPTAWPGWPPHWRRDQPAPFPSGRRVRRMGRRPTRRNRPPARPHARRTSETAPLHALGEEGFPSRIDGVGHRRKYGRRVNRFSRSCTGMPQQCGDNTHGDCCDCKTSSSHSPDLPFAKEIGNPEVREKWTG